MGKYRLTIVFAATAVVMIAVATLIVNQLIGKLTEDNLVRIAEENSTRDAEHIESMLRGGQSMPAMSSGAAMSHSGESSMPEMQPPTPTGQNSKPDMTVTGPTSEGDAMPHMQKTKPLTLDFLTGAEGLTSTLPMLVMGFNITDVNLFDLNGTVVWSTDPQTIGKNNLESLLYQRAAAGKTASKLSKGDTSAHLGDAGENAEIVATLLPLKDTQEGQIIGVMEIHRDVSDDVAVQVDQAKSAVLRITVPTMGGLFLFLVAFMMVADKSIYRSRKREVSLVETQLEERRRAAEELQQARDEALEATRAKSAFLANMSHELRTPLNGIIGYSEMLQEEAKDLDQDDFTPDLQKIHASGKHLLELINDILDISKIEAGKMELYIESFDIPEMVQNVAVIIHPLVAKNANTLEVHCEDNLGSIRADMTKVRQVLFNLLSNASKFTEGGTISFDVARRTEDGTDWISFSVTDTGIGMTSDQMGSIFKAFSQADASTSRKYGGTGLGLALSRGLCQMMGGDIAVESEVGRGSTFTAKLPTVVAEPEVEPVPLEEFGADSPPEGAPTVLAIDDDPMLHDLMKRFLAREGVRVESALGGEEGLRLAKELHPDAITLDVMMPGMDGWAVLTALKADPDLAHTPVIMLTFTDGRNLSYTLGASDYIVKPIDRAQLIAVLNRHQREHSPRSVLVVDDNDENRQVMCRMLKREGWTVIEAEDGRVGLERVANSRPQLILIDLMMPDMVGFGFMDELVKRHEWRDIPVVVITDKDITAEDRLRLDGYGEQIARMESYSSGEPLQRVSELLKSFVHKEVSVNRGP